MVPLPGKSIYYVVRKTAEDDAYNVKFYDAVLLHLGAVDCLNILQGKDQYTSEHDIIFRYRDLVDEIRKHNPFCYIIFSAILPFYEFRHSDLTLRINSMLERYMSERYKVVFISAVNQFTFNYQVLEHLYSPLDHVHLNEEGVDILKKFFSQSISPQDLLNKYNSKRRKNLAKLLWWQV